MAQPGLPTTPSIWHDARPGSILDGPTHSTLAPCSRLLFPDGNVFTASTCRFVLTSRSPQTTASSLGTVSGSTSRVYAPSQPISLPSPHIPDNIPQAKQQGHPGHLPIPVGSIPPAEIRGPNRKISHRLYTSLANRLDGNHTNRRKVCKATTPAQPATSNKSQKNAREYENATSERQNINRASLVYKHKPRFPVLTSAPASAG